MTRSDKLAIAAAVIASGANVAASLGIRAESIAMIATGMALIGVAGTLYIASLFVEDER